MSKSLLLALLGFACAAAAQLDPSIADRLRVGGYVLFMRHTSTDQGRAEARAIGEHLKRLRIPVGEVLASPFCRTMETARLVFGRAQATPDARGGPARTDDATRYNPLRKLLSSPVPPGENRVISSHGNPFHAVAGPPYLAEGEIAVLRPEGNLRFSVIARIRPEDWSGLRAAAGRASSAAP